VNDEDPPLIPSGNESAGTSMNLLLGPGSEQLDLDGMCITVINIHHNMQYIIFADSAG
jgi:hypothetical protein